MSDDDKGGLPAVAVNLAALRKKANQALDDCEFYSGGTGQKLEVLAMHGEAALSMIPTILAEFRSAIARAEAAEAQVQALMTKVDALCSKGQCGCSWDHEGDVFEYHSPKLVAALAQVERLREAAAPFVTHYKPWMDEYPDADRCWAYPILNMGTVRKLRAALAGKEPSDG